MKKILFFFIISTTSALGSDVLVTGLYIGCGILHPRLGLILVIDLSMEICRIQVLLKPQGYTGKSHQVECVLFLKFLFVFLPHSLCSNIALTCELNFFHCNFQWERNSRMINWFFLIWCTANHLIAKVTFVLVSWRYFTWCLDPFFDERCDMVCR